MRSLISQKSGKVIAVNNDALLEIPYQLVMNQPNNRVTLAALASSQWLSMGVNGDGPVLLTKLGASRTGAFRFQMRVFDGQNTIVITSSPIHSSAFLGTGLNPYPFPCPLYIDDNRRVDVFINDISNASNAISPSLRGYQTKFLTPDPQGKKRADKLIANRLTYPMFYTLDVGSITLTALQVSQQTITVQTAHDFHLYQISGVSTGTYTIDIIDANTGESLFNSMGDNHYPLADNLVVGTNTFPMRLKVPRMFYRGQKILINLTDTSNASNTIDLCFGGRATALFLPGLTHGDGE